MIETDENVSYEPFEYFAEVYDEYYSTEECIQENQRIREWLQNENVQEATALLELGVGTGLFLDLFPDFPPTRYYGIDGSECLLNQARRKHPEHCFERHNLNLGIPFLKDESCEIVLSLFFLNHIDQVECLMDEIHRVLTPGGKWIHLIYTQLWTPGNPMMKTIQAQGLVDLNLEYKLNGIKEPFGDRYCFVWGEK